MRLRAECCSYAAQHAVYLCSLLVDYARDVSRFRRGPRDVVGHAAARGRELRIALELAELESEVFVSKLVRGGRALGDHAPDCLK